jgi:hypothetical protein
MSRVLLSSLLRILDWFIPKAGPDCKIREVFSLPGRGVAAHHNAKTEQN